MKKYKVKIAKIVPVGMCKSYDLYVDSPSHSYIANGFITHNSLHSGQAMMYTNRKLGKDKAKSMHPILDNITKETQHTILYQEQVMQVMHQVGNMSWATAEMARKVITKSKGADAFNKLRKEFVTNANSLHKMPIEEAEKLYDVVSTFGCLPGDTIIHSQFKGKITIHDAYHFLQYNIDILAMNSTGKMEYNSVKKIHYTGRQKVFQIKTVSNKIVQATKNHRFLIDDDWKKVSQIVVGDCIMTMQNDKISTHYETITEIKEIGEKDTYDIEMVGAPRNFAANSFISHNSYGFNKCHAVEYSMISYYCAWLKVYYPEYFYKSILKFESDPVQIQNFIQEAEGKGIYIEYPEINKSLVSYDIVNKKIYAGLDSIVGLGTKASEKIIKNRPYTSIEQFKKKTKVNENIFKGLVIADAFREFNSNKKAILEAKKTQINLMTDFAKPLVKPKIEDYTDNEYVQLLYQHTTLKPRINIAESYDFGNYDFVNVMDLGEEHSNKQILMRGIITEVVNKDKITRNDLLEHTHRFERHTIYLNLNDGTGNLAVVMSPHTYELYQNYVKNLVGCPLIVLGTIAQDYKKMYCDIIQVVDGNYKSNNIDKIFLDNSLKGGEAYITAASPAVSKKGKSYYRVKLYNGNLNRIEGLCFRLTASKLLPGTKVRWSMNQSPFLDIFPITTIDI